MLMCPECQVGDLVLRSHRRTLEYVLSMFGVLPYRCGHCNKRFYSTAKHASHQPEMTRVKS